MGKLKTLAIVSLIISLSPYNVLSQHIKIAPYSLMGNASISVGYKQVSLHYFKQLNRVHRYRFDKTYGGLETPSAFAISLSPIDLKYVKIGGMVFNKKFPTDMSTNLHFIIDAGYTFNKLRISWTHISNGFGIIHESNPSYDALGISYYF